MRSTARSRVFLALGGNLGNPLQAFQTACRQLRQNSEIELVAASKLYRTPPVGGPDGQPDYLNAVIELATSLSPHELCSVCQQLEQAAGRQRTVHWSARTLDLDLLFYGQRTIRSANLRIPHPRLHERHFVLLPLRDLAADFVHPERQQTVSVLLAALPEATGISCLKDEWIEL